MKIVRILITTNRGHIGVETFAFFETVFLKCQPLPFCKGMYDFNFLVSLLFNAEFYRTFHAV